MSSSTTLTQLINLLTRPLIFTQPAITVAQLQLALQANLSTLFNTESFAPFTLYLSAHALPIPPIYAACLSLGLSWESWVTALSSGKDLYVFVMEGCIRVGVPNMQETVVVWKESSETKASSTTTASKLQAMLDSARARKQAEVNANAQASSTSTSTLPTLRITPSTPLPPSPSETSSPVSASSSSSETDSDSDSDSDSDTESTTSSTTTLSSISSTSPSLTKPKTCSNAFGTQFFIPTTTTTTTTVKKAIAIPRAQRRREWVAQSRASLSVPVSVSPVPSSRAAKATIMKYTYQGGQTGVMTGGVMLGGKGSGAVAAATAAAVTTPASGTGTGAGSANWRRSSSSSSKRA